MTIEVCRAELASMGGPATEIAERLEPAKDLARHTAEQLRAAIYALHRAADEPTGPLPVMLERLSTVHQPTNLHVKVMLEGHPEPRLPPEVEQSILRWTGKHCSTRRRTARPRARWSGCVTGPMCSPSASPTTGPATRPSCVAPCGCHTHLTCPDGTAGWRTCWPWRMTWWRVVHPPVPVRRCHSPPGHPAALVLAQGGRWPTADRGLRWRCMRHSRGSGGGRRPGPGQDRARGRSRDPPAGPARAAGPGARLAGHRRGPARPVRHWPWLSGPGRRSCCWT